MVKNAATYHGDTTPMHVLDARVKLVLLLVYSFSLLVVGTWGGLFFFGVLLINAIATARFPWRLALRQLVPLGILLAFAILMQSFATETSASVSASPSMGASVSFNTNTSFFPPDKSLIFPGYPLVPLPVSFGGLSFSPAGCERGVFLALRIVLLVMSSLVFTYTTADFSIARALEDMLHPFRGGRGHAHARDNRREHPKRGNEFGYQGRSKGKQSTSCDAGSNRWQVRNYDVCSNRWQAFSRDAATVASLALRFIPVFMEEFRSIVQAQRARGAHFNRGRIQTRFLAWTTLLIPLFVGLYRHADTVAVAMDARAYGAGPSTRLSDTALTFSDYALVIVVSLFCIGVAVVA